MGGISQRLGFPAPPPVFPLRTRWFRIGSGPTLRTARTVHKDLRSLNFGRKPPPRVRFPLDRQEPSPSLKGPQAPDCCRGSLPNRCTGGSPPVELSPRDGHLRRGALHERAGRALRGWAMAEEAGAIHAEAPVVSGGAYFCLDMRMGDPRGGATGAYCIRSRRRRRSPLGNSLLGASCRTRS